MEEEQTDEEILEQRKFYSKLRAQGKDHKEARKLTKKEFPTYD